MTGTPLEFDGVEVVLFTGNTTTEIKDALYNEVYYKYFRSNVYVTRYMYDIDGNYTNDESEAVTIKISAEATKALPDYAFTSIEF